MSLYSMLRTGVSGMNAQSNKLGTISDNIANAGTTGYKRATTEFSTLLLASGQGEYNSGAVNTDIRYGISTQGATKSTTSTTDLMIEGDGFFVVSDDTGQTYLTRAGSFTVDAETGNLVNAAGFTLMGYDLTSGTTQVLNSTEGLVAINLGQSKFSANPTTEGTFTANLPLVADGEDIDDQVSSITTYDNLGNAVTLNLTYSYDSASSSWTMTVTDDATDDVLFTQALTFDGSGDIDIDPSTVEIPIPGGDTLALDISNMTNLNGDYEVVTAEVNGNAASLVENVSIGTDGIVYAVDDSGQKIPLFQIPLATVPSPDNLKPSAGNVYMVTADSGDLQIRTANEAGAGKIVSNSLESSTVDIATELTDMIVAQRDYTANSKVVQTGSELLDVLMNLKR